MEAVAALVREDGLDDTSEALAGIHNEPDPYQQLIEDPNSRANADLRAASLSKLGSIARKKYNIMKHEDFCEKMRSANEKQKEFLVHLIHHLQNVPDNPLQIFFTSPAGCGKTWTLQLATDIYNRLHGTDGVYNAYINCASTGKAAVAINGTTLHNAFKITIGQKRDEIAPLSTQNLHLYQTLFRFVKVIIVDEVSMVSAQLLVKLDHRLRQITGLNRNFGWPDMILVGDLRQLPPVNSTPIYRTFGNLAQQASTQRLWQQLKLYQLTEVMQQSDKQFSNILMKIGDGKKLNKTELELIESRFFTKEQVKDLCPD